MSTLADAFQRLGIKPIDKAPTMTRTEYRIAAAPNFRTMADDELAQAIAVLEQDRIVISERLDDDARAGYPLGFSWRQSAGTARAYKVAHIKLAQDEQARRAPPEGGR